MLPLLFVLLLKLQQLLQLVAAHHQPEQFAVKDLFFYGTSDFAALALGRPGLDRLMSSTGQVGDSASWRGGGLGGAQRQIVHLIVNHCFWYQGGIKCGNRGTGFLDSEGSH